MTSFPVERNDQIYTHLVSDNDESVNQLLTPRSALNQMIIVQYLVLRI